MSPRTSPPMAVAVLLAALLAIAAEPSPNTWVKLDKATIEGRRHDVPLGYDSGLKRFFVLGGRTNFDDYKKPRSYDELALDSKEGEWENWFPAGKDWGSRFGPCHAPGWKAVLMAAHERSFGLRGGCPFGVVLTQSANRFSDEASRAVVADAAAKLGVAKLVWSP